MLPIQQLAPGYGTAPAKTIEDFELNHDD